MFGASHLGPYTDEQPQLGVVERVAVAFLNYYLKGEGSPSQIKNTGDISGISTVDGGP
jgi:hypothetical protein